MVRSKSSFLRAVTAVALLAVFVLGIAAPLAAAPGIGRGDNTMDVASADEIWGAGRKWWHCAVSIAFAGLASAFAGSASPAIVAAAVVGCMS